MKIERMQELCEERGCYAWFSAISSCWYIKWNRYCLVVFTVDELRRLTEEEVIDVIDRSQKRLMTYVIEEMFG